MTNYKTLIYIATTGSSVFESQVISFLKEVKEHNFFSRIILLAGVKITQKWEAELCLLLKSGLEVMLFKQYPNYTFYSGFQKREFSIILKRILTDNTIVHLRGEFFTRIIKEITQKNKIKNIKVLTDIRGLAEEEIRLYLKGVYNPIKYNIKLYQAKQNLKNAGIYSDFISCVSESLLKTIKEKGISNDAKLDVNYCIAGRNFRYSHRKRWDYRLKIGVEEKDILCVFVTGGFSLYENTTELIRHLIGNGYKFLNLSKIRIPDAINLFVPYDEVPNYLCAADVGIVWRKDDLVNNTSSPVKISEYLCCGLPVIANDSIHLLNDFIRETGYGKVISDPEELDKRLINDLTRIDRKLISETAISKFSSKVIVKNYIKLYDELLSNINAG